MRASLGLLLVVACAGKPTTRPPPVPVTPAQPMVASCSDVGVILRGEVESEQPEAGPAKEKVYAASCVEEQWPQATIDCIASTPQPRTCLDKLDAKQRTAFEARLQTWQDAYAEATGDIDAPPEIDCHTAMADPLRFPPKLADNAPEREWSAKLRRHRVIEECEHDWSPLFKACIQEAALDDKAIEACIAADSDGDHSELTKQLTDLDRLAARIAAAKKKPASITCGKVVAAHYGDRAWKQKLDGYKPAERNKMIIASRTKMTKACTADAWDDTLRACLVAAGGETCFESSGNRLRWGYPAAGTVVATGIAECDTYAAAVAQMAQCANLPQASRDALVRSQEQLLAQIVSMPADKRATMATSCTAGLETIESVTKSVGC